MNKITLKNLDFKDKIVLIRTGFDVPVDKNGKILDDKRIKVSIPTIQYILSNGAKKIILMWHMGRPKGKVTKHLKTNIVTEYLSNIMDEKIVKIDNWGEKDFPENKIIALENLRFNPLEKSKDQEKRDIFGKHLASLADIYINDAFSNSHRDHASMTSVPKFVFNGVGLSVENELRTFHDVLNKPQRPITIIFGGVKADKIDAMSNLTNFADKVLVGGALAYLMLKCSGVNVGSSKIDKEGLDQCEKEIKDLIKDPTTVLPIDCVIANKFAKDAKTKIVDIGEIGDWMALDIGPKTARKYIDIINESKTILWFGPIGVSEFEIFAKGTKNIAQAIADKDAITIIGGGNSADAIRDLGLEEEMTLVSSGGGAALELVQGNSLPAIDVINNN